MPQSSKYVVLNAFRDVAANIRTRNGKQRLTIDVKAEAVGITIDPKALGAGAATAIAKRVGAGIRAITAFASPATIRKRQYAKEHQSESWVQKRYGGGRIGFTPPGGASAVRLFNDSQRLSRNVVARATDRGEFTINVPANRFNPVTFGTGLTAVLARFFQLVDVLRDPGLISADPGFRDSVDKTVLNMIDKAVSVRELAGKMTSMASKLFELGNVEGEEREEQPEA